MTKTITYNLKNSKNSNLFYQELKSFTSIVERKMLSDFTGLECYIQFINTNGLETTRHEREYLFDWLALGILWRHYASTAMNTGRFAILLLKKLYQLRQTNNKLKPYIDPVRGVLSTLWLSKNQTPHYSHNRVTLPNILYFINYLDSTGEFREEVKRFHLIYRFLKNRKDYVKFADEIIELAGWFEEEAHSNFKTYTANVEPFLSKQIHDHRWQEDYLFCSRKEVEYHLNMVGSELLNRSFQSEFNASSRKALLLPACMCSKQNGDCKAKQMSLDSVCTGCDPKCRVNYYTKLGEREGFSVHIIPHSSDFSAWLQDWAVGKDIGVIGVACLLNLMTGGLELKALDIPAQCVFLDHCGCTRHWDRLGVKTDLNEKQLLRILHQDAELKPARACA